MIAIATGFDALDKKIEELIIYLKSQGVFEEKHQKTFDKIKSM